MLPFPRHELDAKGRTFPFHEPGSRAKGADAHRPQVEIIGTDAPFRTTAVASVKMSPAPPTARLARWDEVPVAREPLVRVLAHGRHSNAVQRVSLRNVIGSKRCGILHSAKCAGGATCLPPPAQPGPPGPPGFPDFPGFTSPAPLPSQSFTICFAASAFQVVFSHPMATDVNRGHRSIGAETEGCRSLCEA